MLFARRLTTVNWARIAAEIAITTVGILIALAINAWWQDRQDRKTERVALREIRAGLVLDTTDLLLDSFFYERERRSARQLLAYARERVPYDSSVVDTLIGSLYTKRTHVSSTGAYESLKSAGVSIIEDDSLRLAILTYYGSISTLVSVWNHDCNATRDDEMMPYFVEHVIPSPPETKRRAGKPMDYALMQRDTRYMAVLSNAEYCGRYAVKSYDAAVSAAVDLLHRIDRRLARLK